MEGAARVEAALVSLKPTPLEWERETVLHWNSLIGRRDPFYMSHVANVFEWAGVLAEALGLPDLDVQRLMRGALIHDIGKIDLPGAILSKPGPLTDAERSCLENYCTVGQRLAESLPSFRDVGFMARSHHERLDGSGYPDGLKGAAIPFLVRVLTVADVFEAVRSERVYKAAVSEAEALEIVTNEVRRNWLDAEVVEALERIVKQRPPRGSGAVPARPARPTEGARSPLAGRPEEHSSVAVLVVEDNDDLRRMVSVIVGMMDLAVLTARNGHDALAIIRREPDVGIVLLDLMMPGMDGFEFCRLLQEDPALRQRTHTLHIIIVSARTGSEDKVRGFQLGAADYLTKPFDPRELRARIAVGERLVRQQRVLESQRSLLEEMVRVEPLTGVFSRRFFEQLLREEWSRASRYHHPVSLIMADVDHFKHVNDRYGHSYGDRVLTGLGKVLRDGLREPDIVARYGGEEFVLLLPETAADGARLVAERLRRNVREQTFQHPDGNFHVTMSCGVATVTMVRESSWTVLVDTADQALYRAKLAGRDRTAG